MGSSNKVFYQDSGYPIQRNLVDLPIQKYSIEKKIGVLKVLNHVYYKLEGVNPLLGNSHWELLKKPNGIWHFFNGISFGKTPWVVTFETKVPRWHTEKKWLQEKGVKALASENCKKLIALSECAKQIQIRYLEEEFPSFSSEIIPKLTVIHPPQPTLLNKFEEKKIPGNKFIFTVIGALFFIKGGKEILNVFDRLLRENAPIELNIISTLKLGDHATKATPKDLKNAEKIINNYPNNIHHYERLPNKKVLETLRQSHIGLLTSYGDTYGYSVLEAQACGCPVISTNIRALPEINNDRCGWVINVPKDRCGNGILKTETDRKRFSKIIEENLYKIISDIIANPDQIPKKGANSYQRIKKEHDPEILARRLEKIYDETFNSF